MWLANMFALDMALVPRCLPTTGLDWTQQLRVDYTAAIYVWCNRFNPFSVAFHLQLCSHEGRSWDKDSSNTGAVNENFIYLCDYMHEYYTNHDDGDKDVASCEVSKEPSSSFDWGSQTDGLDAFKTRKISCWGSDHDSWVVLTYHRWD